MPGGMWLPIFGNTLKGNEPQGRQFTGLTQVLPADGSWTQNSGGEGKVTRGSPGKRFLSEHQTKQTPQRPAKAKAKEGAENQ